MKETWKATVARCFFRDDDDAFRSPVAHHDAHTFATKVVRDRVLRVRVLDVRSRAPVADAVIRHAWILPPGVPDPKQSEEASYDKKYAALHVPAPIDWDLAAHPPIHEGSSRLKGFVKGNWSGLKGALHALGYRAGTGQAADASLERALNEFREDHGISPPKPKTEDRTTIKRVIEEHNRGALRMVQRYLTAYGFPCDADDGEWKSSSKDAFLAWQKLHPPVPKKPKSMPDRGDIARLLRDNTHFKTNGLGVASFPIPLPKMREGFRLVVAFDDFATIPVAAIPDWRKPGDVTVEWKNTQDLETGNLGWGVRPPGDARETSALPELLARQGFTVAALPSLSWSDLSDADARRAQFNDDFRNDRSAEIDVAALVWCQPAWDAFDDPKVERHNKNVYLPARPKDLPVRHRHLHVVTRYVAGGTAGLGNALDQSVTAASEGYGLLDMIADGPDAPLAHYRGNHRSHMGLDVLVKKGDPVFAFHGGHLTTGGGPTNGAGNTVTVQHKAKPGIYLSYFHLEAGAGPKRHVRAGEIIGRLGRTGNINAEHYTPSHVHMERHGADTGFTFGLAYLTHDDANRVCIPRNDTVGRVFPCRCQMNPGAGDDDINACGFLDKKFTNSCWAVGKLVCPHMRDPGTDVFRHQAQLRVAGYPCIVNGVVNAATKQAIAHFRAANGLPPGNTLDDAALALLDQQAPILAPES